MPAKGLMRRKVSSTSLWRASLLGQNRGVEVGLYFLGLLITNAKTPIIYCTKVGSYFSLTPNSAMEAQGPPLISDNALMRM